MSDGFSFAVVDRIKERVHAFVADNRNHLKGCHDLDVRLEVSEAKGACVQNGTAKQSYDDAELSIGIRVHAGESMIAPGYFRRELGSTDVQQPETLLGDGIELAHRLAWANAARKMEAERVLGPLSNALTSTPLAPIQVYQDTVVRPVRIHPATIPLSDMLGEAVSVSQPVTSQDARGLFSSVRLSSPRVRELFASSEGALIDQLYPLIRGFLSIVAREPGSVPEWRYVWPGDPKGWELLEDDNVYGRTSQQFAHDLTQDTIEPVTADMLDPTPVVGDSYLIEDGELGQPLQPNTVRINDDLINLFQQIIAVTRDRKPTLVWSAEETLVAPELAVQRVHVESIAEYTG
jgi:predicted Zn-dependent protease